MPIGESTRAMPAWPRQQPHGLLARFCLAMVATAGLFYVNILPALVDGLVTGLGFTTAQAGEVVSANIYGAAVGALAAVALVGRFNWHASCALLLLLLMVLDASSTLVAQPVVLTTVRFAHGCVGGLLVGVAYSAFARTQVPARTFGVLLVVQYGLGGLGVMWLPLWVEVAGAQVLFWSLFVFSLVSLGLLGLLPAYPPLAVKANETSDSGATPWLPLVLTLIALFLFQGGNNGPYAFIMGLAKAAQLSVAEAGRWLGVAAWLGMLGAALVVYCASHYRRLPMLALSMLITVVGTWVLMYSNHSGMFAVANCLVGVTWAFVVAYLLGMVADLDASGRMTALAGFASKMGLASGSLAATQLVAGSGEDMADYRLALVLACIALLLAWALTLLPARRLDTRMQNSGTTVEEL